VRKSGGIGGQAGELTQFDEPGPWAAVPTGRRMSASGILRQARRDDIVAVQRVRAAVRENRLRSHRISDEEVRRHLELLGRGWVIEVDGEVVAFAIGDASIGNIWALFVDPRHERRGYGRRLHAAMVEWLWSQGFERLWLTTEAGTRAVGFYRAAGWRETGMTPKGELGFVLDRPPRAGHCHLRESPPCPRSLKPLPLLRPPRSR